MYYTLSALLLCCLVASVYSYSGNLPPTCAINDDILGCNLWNNGTGNTTRDDLACYNSACRLNCVEEGRIMDWAGSPMFAPDFYTLGRKDGKTTYYPGETVILKLETKRLDRLFRGLVMYGVTDLQDDNSRVGTFEVLASEKLFYVPDVAEGHPCSRVLLHTGAAEKPIVLFFRYKAPAANTGTVHIKAMVKFGNANTGEFYKPNSEYLQLTEAQNTADTSYVRSDQSQSCTDACAQKANKTCDESLTAQLSSENTDDVIDEVGCSFPMLSVCDSNTVEPYASSDVCYFQADSCSQSTPTCADVASAGTQRVCACRGNTNPAPGVNPPPGSAPANTPGSAPANTPGNAPSNSPGKAPGVKSPSTNPAMRLGLSPTIFMAVIVYSLLSFFKKPRALFVFTVIVMLTMVPQASAHNWMVSYARAGGSASRIFPCQAPRTPKPHIQLANNQQKFHVEWSTGHDRMGYFVLLAKEDELKLLQHSANAFNEYVDEAKAVGHEDLVTQRQYQKQHRAFRSSVDANEYREEITGTQWEFPRPLDCQIRKVGSSYRTFRYTDEQLTTGNGGNLPDAVIIGFDSPTYPWIKGVWRYEIEIHYPSDVDVAEIHIPSNYSAGDYILQYWWGGYYDCVDINVVDTTVDVDLPCGNRTGNFEEMRIDHCYYPEPLSYFGPPIKIIDGDLQPCLDKCKRHTAEGCVGTMFFPMNLSGTAVPESMRNFFLDEYGIKSMNEYEWGVRSLDSSHPNYFGLPNRARALDPDCNPLDPCLRMDMWYNLYDSIARDQPAAQQLRDWITQQFQSASADDMYCVGVEARPQTNTDDVLITTSDPRHPAFYSTCYSVVPEVTFSGFDNVKLGGEFPPHKFGDLCIDCESRRGAAAAVINPTWTVLDGINQECEACELKADAAVIPDPPAVEYPYDMLVTVPETRCRSSRDNMATNQVLDNRLSNDVPVNENDFRNQRAVDGGCPNDTRCTIHLGEEIGWGPTDTTYVRQVCAHLAANHPQCDQNAVWIDRQYSSNWRNRRFRPDWGCRCASTETCCGGCEMERQINSDLFAVYKTPTQTTRAPISNCTSDVGTLSGDGSLCCDKRCTVCDRSNQGVPMYPSNPTDYYTCQVNVLEEILNAQYNAGGEYYCDKIGPPCVIPVSM